MEKSANDGRRKRKQISPTTFASAVRQCSVEVIRMAKRQRHEGNTPFQNTQRHVRSLMCGSVPEPNSEEESPQETVPARPTRRAKKRHNYAKANVSGFGSDESYETPRRKRKPPRKKNLKMTS